MSLRASLFPPSPRTTAQWDLITVLLSFSGLLLTDLFGSRYLIVVALGVFAPLLLRLLAILPDEDEFRLHSLQQAGLLSFLATSFVLLICILLVEPSASLQGGDFPVQADALLALALIVFFLSYFLRYWSAALGSLRIFRIFCAYGLIQTVARYALPGSGASLWAIAVQVCVILVVFGLPTLTVRRWPRQSGITLVVLGLLSGFAYTRTPAWALTHHGQHWKNAYPLLLLCLPYVACGLALLRQSERPRGVDPSYPRDL